MDMGLRPRNWTSYKEEQSSQALALLDLLRKRSFPKIILIYDQY
jgi:hypothetical protein